MNLVCVMHEINKLVQNVEWTSTEQKKDIHENENETLPNCSVQYFQVYIKTWLPDKTDFEIP